MLLNAFNKNGPVSQEEILTYEHFLSCLTENISWKHTANGFYLCHAMLLKNCRHKRQI